MNYLVAFPLQDGGNIVIQVDETNMDMNGTIPIARGNAIETAKDTLESALDKIIPAARNVVGKLQVMQPGAIEVSFGIALSFTAGAFITAGSNANFGVKISWTGDTKHVTATTLENTKTP